MYFHDFNIWLIASCETGKKDLKIKIYKLWYIDSVFEFLVSQRELRPS